MIIKKYNLYKESLSDNEITLEKFANDLLNICEHMSRNKRNNTLWASNLSLTSRDPQSDLNLFKQRMLTKGWDMESIVELFEKEDVTRSITDDNLIDKYYTLSVSSKLTSQNGMIDLYLMWCDSFTGNKHKDLLEFGGAGIDDPEEAVVKYNYGYHKTKYGKMYVETSFGTLDNFKKKAFQKIEDIFSDSRIPYLDTGPHINSNKIMYDMVDEGYIIKDEKDLSMSLDMKHIFLTLQQAELIPDSVEYEEFVESWIDYFSERFDSYSYNKTTLKLFL